MPLDKVNNTGGVYETGGEPELTAKKPSKLGAFMGGLGKVASVAAGVMLPGVGPIVGGILAGKSPAVPPTFSAGWPGPPLPARQPHSFTPPPRSHSTNPPPPRPYRAPAPPPRHRRPLRL